MSFTVYGIRHHGPGSAKSLKKALQKSPPDLLLVEGPPDANNLIENIADEALIPPLAILVYNPSDLAQAAYFPFAKFSPEWQAIKYALKCDIPVRFMDLPQAFNYSLDQEEKNQKQLSIALEKKASSKDSADTRKLLRDPLAYIAEIAGYDDSERWWEISFERSENEEAIFPAIIDLMSALRNELNRPSPDREILREAFMRKTIRQGIKEGYQNIAVVCGAWHSPVLHNLEEFKSSIDNALLKGIKKTKTKSTWVPWTYDRLSRQSGYAAGVLSPAWYELLFGNKKEVVIRWMTKAARLFRQEDLDASSAHVIEAVRLAETLATIRELQVPGINELYEAAVSIFCEGYTTKMELIEQRLIIGNSIGKVPDSIPMIPLQQNLEKTIKSARLSKEYQAAEAVDKKLDLRKDNHLLASHLLHRLNIIGIPWGKQKRGSQYNTGGFSETWKLHWRPDYAIRIIEAGMWGNTVENAATFKIIHTSKETDHLAKLSELVDSALNAQLSNAIDPLVERLQSLSALSKDVFHLMDTLEPLVNAIRYGSTRNLELSALSTLIQQIIPRVCIGLPNACIGMNEAASKEIFEQFQKTNRAINLLNIDSYQDQWLSALNNIIEIDQVNGILRGACTRILFDKTVLNMNQTADQMHLALSKANDAIKAAHWLEGFLHGSGLLLIHNPKLWNILDQWVAELDMENLQDLLPLLRRTFANFSGPERQKMLQLAQTGQLKEVANTETPIALSERASKIIPTVKTLLGFPKN